MEFIDKSQIMQGIESDSTAEILQKGKVAMVGEVREWQGKKYKKQVSGKWVEVSEQSMTKKEHGEKLSLANSWVAHTENKDKEANEAWKKEQSKHKETVEKLSDEEVDLDDKLSRWDRISKRAEESKDWTPEQHRKKAKELNSQMISLEVKGKSSTKEYKELKEDRDSHEAKARKKSFLKNLKDFEEFEKRGYK